MQKQFSISTRNLTGFVIKQTLTIFAATTKKTYDVHRAVVVLLVLNSSASILYCQLIRLTCSIT